MRGYTKVSPRYWTGRLGLTIKGDHKSQVLGFYLLTSPHANMIGLYRLRLEYVVGDLGMRMQSVRSSLGKLIQLGYCKFDDKHDRVWVVEALRHEFGDEETTVLHPRDKRLPYILRLLDEQACSPLAVEMATHYGLPNQPEAWSAVSRRPSHRIPKAVMAAVRDRDGDHCHYCKRIVDWNDRKGVAGATYDHIDPIGPSTVENLVVSCRGCNSSKGFGGDGSATDSDRSATDPN